MTKELSYRINWISIINNKDAVVPQPIPTHKVKFEIEHGFIYFSSNEQKEKWLERYNKQTKLRKDIIKVNSYDIDRTQN